MKTFYITASLLLCIIVNASAQKKHLQTFQYRPAINQKMVVGTITEITKSKLGEHEITWLHLGDTAIHVWNKDITKDMVVGNKVLLQGLQKLTGAKKYLENLHTEVVGLANNTPISKHQR